MRALLTVATGLLGKELLENPPDAVILSRDPGGASRILELGPAVRWYPEGGPAQLEALRGVEPVFHGRCRAWPRARAMRSNTRSSNGALAAVMSAPHRTAT